MYRYKNKNINASTNTPTTLVYVVDIIDSNIEYQVAAAWNHLEYRPNMRKSKQLTEEQIDHLDKVIDSVMLTATFRGFDIEAKWQSSRSYSYYLKLHPENDKYNEIYVYVIFRISDHENDDFTENLQEIQSKFGDFNPDDITTILENYVVDIDELNIESGIITKEVGNKCTELMKMYDRFLGERK